VSDKGQQPPAIPEPPREPSVPPGAKRQQDRVEPEPCIKCGEPRSRLAYVGVHGQAAGGTLLVTCSRCGYQWTIPTLDQGQADER
jgi:DNA-directed RNA polymerase subunit M/transcription elongation factor TFIIS